MLVDYMYLTNFNLGFFYHLICLYPRFCGNCVLLGLLFHMTLYIHFHFTYRTSHYLIRVLGYYMHLFRVTLGFVGHVFVVSFQYLCDFTCVKFCKLSMVGASEVHLCTIHPCRHTIRLSSACVVHVGSPSDSRNLPIPIFPIHYAF